MSAESLLDTMARLRKQMAGEHERRQQMDRCEAELYPSLPVMLSADTGWKRKGLAAWVEPDPVEFRIRAYASSMPCKVTYVGYSIMDIGEESIGQQTPADHNFTERTRYIREQLAKRGPQIVCQNDEEP